VEGLRPRQGAAKVRRARDALRRPKHRGAALPDGGARPRLLPAGAPHAQGGLVRLPRHGRHLPLGRQARRRGRPLQARQALLPPLQQGSSTSPLPATTSPLPARRAPPPQPDRAALPRAAQCFSANNFQSQHLVNLHPELVAKKPPKEKKEKKLAGLEKNMPSPADPERVKTLIHALLCPSDGPSDRPDYTAEVAAHQARGGG